MVYPSFSGQVVVLPKELAELFAQDASLNIRPPAVTHVLQGFGGLPVKHAKIACKWLFEGGMVERQLGVVSKSDLLKASIQ